MMGSFLGLVALNLAALAVRTSYELLKKAGSVDPRSQALFIVILLDMKGGPASRRWVCQRGPACYSLSS